jgi:hypothetical protein
MQNRASITSYRVKVALVGILGLALLVGWAEVSFAIQKTRPGRTYCDCGCKTFSRTTELSWEKVASCSLNGKNCKGTNSAGQVEQGTLVNCQQCQSDNSGGFSDCTPVRGVPAPNLGATTLPVLPGTLDSGPRKPSASQFSNQGMNAPILRRGLEGEGAAPSPTAPEEQCR